MYVCVCGGGGGGEGCVGGYDCVLMCMEHIMVVMCIHVCVACDACVCVCVCVCVNVLY